MTISRSELFSKQIHSLYDALDAPLATNIINSLILSAVLYTQIDIMILGAWFGAHVAVTLIRILLLRRFRKGKMTSDQQAYRYYLGGMIASGILWGSGALFLTSDSIVHTMLVIFISGGMTAGAIGSASYRSEAYKLYNFIVLSPYIIYFFLTDKPLYLVMGLMLLIYALMLLVSSKKFHENYLHSIELQFVQKNLLDTLADEKERIQNLNSSLSIEMEHKILVQKELEDAIDKIQKASKAKDAFFASMSHELRTPLNAIIGFSQIMSRKQDLQEPFATYNDKILTAGKHLLDLVNTILDLAKLRSGKIEVHCNDFETVPLFKDIHAIIEPLAEPKSLIVSYPDDAPLNIIADRKMVFQIFINLLSNAIKFSPEFEQIAVRYKHDETFHIFSVVDHGPGIEESRLESIFDPFIQIEENVIHHQGTGLGLSIVKEMVQHMGGKVWIESSLGSGSSFYFSLPLECSVSEGER